MRWLVLFWAAVEVAQLAVIAMLVVGYRNLQRRLDAHDRFETKPPRSVTED